MIGPKEARFWAKVDQSGGPEACWPWMAANLRGYGQIRVAGRTVQAHRLAWELTHGPIPPGHEVCHTVCDNPPCCNPRHMTTKPHKGNMEEMVVKGRQAKGERNASAKLTGPTVLEIRRVHAEEGLGCRRLASRFNVHEDTVSHVLAGRTWAWLKDVT